MIARTMFCFYKFHIVQVMTEIDKTMTYIGVTMAPLAMAKADNKRSQAESLHHMIIQMIESGTFIYIK